MGIQWKVYSFIRDVPWEFLLTWIFSKYSECGDTVKIVNGIILQKRAQLIFNILDKRYVETDY